MSAAVAKKVVAPKKSKPTAVAAAQPVSPVGKAAINKKVESSKKQKKSAGGAKPDKVKRNKDGLLASQNKFRRDCKRVWAGDISSEAPLILGGFMQYFLEIVIQAATGVARNEDPNATVTPAHLQGALTGEAWLSRSGLVKGRVGGAAPMMFDSKYNNNDSE